MYEQIWEFKNLYSAYLKARKGKRYKKDVLFFSYYLEENLLKLQNELREKTYKVGDYYKFIIYDPKKREIVALPFRDRIVQHAINNILEPLFDKCMIYDSYACRKNKGTHKARNRLYSFLVKNNNEFYLKCDIQSYFSSVNKNILYSILKRKVSDTSILELLKTIIDSHSPGIPIGNLMSQLFANIYLSELDFFLKVKKQIKYYVRYMDDFIILNKDKNYLKKIFTEIDLFLINTLNLTLNKKSHMGQINRGVEFVGYRFWKNNILIKKQSIFRMNKRFKAWKKGKIKSSRLEQILSSWKSYFNNTNSLNTINIIINTHYTS